LSLAIIAVIALVERPRLLAMWTVLFGSVLSFGLLNTPRWTYSPDAMSLASSLTFSLAFFSLFLLEFRTTMHNAIEALRTQAAALAQTNTDLHRTMQERDGLSERLATSQRVEAMGRMAGSIAHDFNNLLTVIRGYADMVAEDTPAGSGHRAEVDHLVKAIARASNVTREVLDFATPRSITMQRSVAFVREPRACDSCSLRAWVGTPTAPDCTSRGSGAAALLLQPRRTRRTPDGGVVRVPSV
jgi:signal transduction histidine kinase